MKTPLAHPVSKRFKENLDESYFILSQHLRANLKGVKDFKDYDDAYVKWTDENIDLVAEQLEELAHRDALMMTLDDYFEHTGIDQEYWIQLAKKNPRVKRSIDRAKRSIGIRREQATWMNDFSVTVMLKTAGQYLPIYYEAEQDSENIKAAAKVAAEASLRKETFIFTREIIGENGEKLKEVRTIKPIENDTDKPL